MRQWNAGLLAAVMVGVVGMGCGGVEPMEESTSGETERYLEELHDDNNQCGKRICFDPIEREKNITHIFLDFGNCPVENVRVFLKTESRGTEEVTDRLKRKGGPCKELGADFRFEVPGPDREATVCIIFKDFVTNNVRIGSKAADECRYEGNNLEALEGNDCRRCKKSL